MVSFAEYIDVRPVFLGYSYVRQLVVVTTLSQIQKLSLLLRPGHAPAVLELGRWRVNLLVLILREGPFLASVEHLERWLNIFNG